VQRSPITQSATTLKSLRIRKSEVTVCSRVWALCARPIVNVHDHVGGTWLLKAIKEQITRLAPHPDIPRANRTSVGLRNLSISRPTNTRISCCLVRTIHQPGAVKSTTGVAAIARSASVNVMTRAVGSKTCDKSCRFANFWIQKRCSCICIGRHPAASFRHKLCCPLVRETFVRII